MYFTAPKQGQLQANTKKKTTKQETNILWNANNIKI
jgi:hypothetical protein